MSTIDLRKGTLVGERGNAYQVRDYVGVNLYDARKNPGTAADIVQLLSVSERQLVDFVHMEVVRVEGSAATVDVGDSASATQYQTALDVNTLAQTLSAAAARNLYGIDDDIRLTLNDDLANAAVYIKAKFVDFANDLALYYSTEDAN